MSWAPEVYVDNKWSRNSLRFATKEEAEASAQNLTRRWTLVENWRVTESEDPVNYKWENGMPVAVI